MSFFKKFVSNIFAKIILAFIILTFVLFGVSDFLLNSSGTWAAKVGNNGISGSAFNKALQTDRNALLQTRKDEEVLRYLGSNQFKSDVLERLVNKLVTDKMRNEFSFSASRKLLMQEIAKNQLFRNKNGKFDYELLKKFLAQNGINDRDYIETIFGEIETSAIVQSLSMTSPHNPLLIAELENFKQQKRVADVIKFSVKNVGNIAQSSAKELEEFFTANKNSYALPETRAISYLQFSKEFFAKDLEVTDAELFGEYERNKGQLLRPEKRNFYHVVFEKAEEAQSFVDKLDAVNESDRTKRKEAFAKIAKESLKKDLKAISANGIFKKDFIPELADATFALALGEHSTALQSPMGFHVFMVTEITAEQPLSFGEAKADLRKSLLKNREENVLQAKIDGIDDIAITSASLKEVVEKANLKSAIKQVKLDANGKDENGKAVTEIAALNDFTANSFNAKKGRVSKVFASKNFDNFYLLQVDEITASHDRDLTSVKAQVAQDLMKKKRQEALRDLATNLQKELQQSPDSASRIATSHGLKLEQNREFQRFIQIDMGDGRKMTHRSKLLDELFAIKVGGATTAVSENNEEFIIAILREIKRPNMSDEQFNIALQDSVNGFRQESLQVFSSYMLKKYPVKINEKLFQAEE